MSEDGNGNKYEMFVSEVQPFMTDEGEWDHKEADAIDVTGYVKRHPSIMARVQWGEPLEVEMTEGCPSKIVTL